LSDAPLTVDDEGILRRVGRYEIVREVGRGGTAVVYLARQTDLARPVALKELAGFHATDAVLVERFLREARLAGSLSHPNVVTVYEYFEDDGTPFISMEYFARGSLRPLLSELTLPRVAGVLEGVLAGLAHAESHGIVHRDLKPENVMVTTSGTVKIADFGIAKALQTSPEGSLTTTGKTVGTPVYMAPELALGGEIGSWTDLYAAGVMAYEMLAGRAPFDGSEMPVAVLLRHVNEQVPPLGAARPDLDPRLVVWVHRLLSKSPGARPRTAGEAWDELEEIVLATLGPRWRRDARLSSGDAGELAPAAVPSAVPAAATTRAQPRHRRRWPLIAAVAALVVAGGAAVFALLATGDSGGESPAAPPSRPSVADYVPKPSERYSLAVSGPAVFAGDPNGRVLALARGSHDRQVSMRDPLGVRAIAVQGGHLFVADGSTIVELRADTLAPLGSLAFPGVSAFAGGSTTPLFAAARVSGRGRVCEVLAGPKLGVCLGTGFAPSGLGAAGRKIFVADPRGAVLVLARGAGSLHPVAPPLAVGRRPHGNLITFQGRLYVPLARGIRVVTLATGQAKTIPLSATPSSLWIAPGAGTLFAAVPATGKVAVVDAARPASPRLLEVGGKPVAVAGGTSRARARPVYVVGAEGRRMTTLDARTGVRLGSTRVAGLGAPPPEPLELHDAADSTSGLTTTVQLELTGGALQPSSVTTLDPRIRDGSAAIELWQGGIRSAFATKKLGATAIRVGRRPGRLRITFTTTPGSFTSFVVRPVRPHAVELQLVAPRPSIRHGGTSSTTGGGSTVKPKKPTGGTGGTGDTGTVIQF